MDKKLKRALDAAYCAPAPAGKADFLRRHRRREIGRWELAVLQAGYIRWWTWAASLTLFGLILAASPAGSWGLWCAAALTPFLALLAVTENGRSRLHRMEELELACRMSRQAVLLARMAALGLFHLVLLAGLTPALAVWGAVGAVRAGAYLLTPYLLTAALGLELARRVRGREYLPVCGGAAALVSAAGMMLMNWQPALYEPEGLPLWGAAMTVTVFATGAEIAMELKGAEKVQWS